MADLNNICHEEDWPNEPKYLIGIDPAALTDEQKVSVTVYGNEGKLDLDNDNLVSTFHSGDDSIIEERFNRTFRMTEAKRRLAEYPRTPNESFTPKDLSEAIAIFYVRELEKFVPKPERTDRLLEYNTANAYKFFYDHMEKLESEFNKRYWGL